MTVEAQETTTLHGGRLVAKRLKAHGVTKLFTLSGGHLFSIYDGCREEGIDIVDTRHERPPAFAAEGWAKVTREPGVCALTAGPGRDERDERARPASQNGSPMLVLGGRAPAMRWGQGSLQEIDHVPFVRPLTKLRDDRGLDRGDPGLVDEALTAAVNAAHRADVHRLPARSRVHGGAGGAGVRRAPAGRPRRRPRVSSAPRAAARRRAAGDHGRHGAVLGPRRGGAARAGRGAADPGVPQRPGARLRAGRPRVVLRARAASGAAGRGCRAGDRRADGLPARVRRVVRRGHRDRRDRRGRAVARPPA